MSVIVPRRGNVDRSLPIAEKRNGGPSSRERQKNAVSRKELPASGQPRRSRLHRGGDGPGGAFCQVQRLRHLRAQPLALPVPRLPLGRLRGDTPRP